MDTNTDRLLASVRLLLAHQPPEYGTPEWHTLPADHPDRNRAVWQAAEAWRRYWTRQAIAERLRAELDMVDRATLERFKAASADVSRAWDMTVHCVGPSHLELQLLRAQPSDRDRLTRAVAVHRELMTDPAISPHDAQLRALAQAGQDARHDGTGDTRKDAA